MADPDGADVVTTARLLLRRPEPSDAPRLFALYADPRVWAADPLSRHDTAAQTDRMIAAWRDTWRRTGLGMWTAWRTAPDGPAFAGIGGCFLRLGVAWNLGFRLAPECWGRGYAQEISAAARVAAVARRPDLPMTAYLVSGNERSRRAVERAGLSRVWRGPDAGNPDPSAIRLLYSDRPLAPSTVETLTRA